jgi:hypothetical protein
MTTSENKQGTLATLAGATGDFVHEWRTLAGIEVFVVLVSFVVAARIAKEGERSISCVEKARRIA